MAKTFDLETILKSFTRKNLNRLVQKNIFSHEYNQFSRDLKAILGGNLSYSLVLSHIQKGLLGASGDKLKYYKDMPASGSVPDYMSAMELIMYRTAIRNTVTYFQELELMTNRYQNFYEAAEKISKEVASCFYKYRQVKNDKLKDTLYYDGEGSVGSVIVKVFDKAIKLGFYNKALSKSALRKDEINLKDHKQVFEFNPYSDLYFNRYENFRKNFVKVVNCLSSDFKLSENSIKNLFQIYETDFYRTNFLSENNVNVIDYTLGLTKGTYFSLKNLNDYENEINHFLEAINAINNCAENSFLSEKQKISFLCKHLSESAKNERSAYIKKNVEHYGRPENSNVFLVACLDLIANKKLEEINKTNAKVNIEHKEFSTQNIQNLPKSFVEKAELVKNSVVEKRKEKESLKVQPTFWDEGFMPEPPITEPSRKPRKKNNKENNMIF